MQTMKTKINSSFRIFKTTYHNGSYLCYSEREYHKVMKVYVNKSYFEINSCLQ